MIFRRFFGLVVVGFSLLAVGCGSPSPSTEIAGGSTTSTPVDSAPTTTTGEPVVEWTTTELGPRGVDSGVAAAAFGERTVVVSSDDGGLAAWVDAGEGWVDAAIGDGPSNERLSVAAAAEVPGGALVVVNDFESFVPQLWFSADGESWEELPAAGIDRPAEVIAVTTIDGVVLVVGSLRVNEDPSQGPFEPVVWRSEDLVTWKTASVETQGEGSVYDVVDADAGLLAVGRGKGGAALWRSLDGGESWVSAPAPEIAGVDGREFYDIAVGDEIVVAVGESWGGSGGRGLVIVNSADGGQTWARASLDAVTAAGLGSAYRIHRAADAFWVIANRRFDAWADPGRCYVDLPSCQGFSEPVVLRSDDGSSWAEIDLEALELPEYFDLHGVVGAADGVSLVGSGENLLVWSWPSFSAPPLRTPPDVLTPPDIELVTWDSQLEVGVTYRYPLYIHCGMGYLANFNDTHWYLADAPEGETETGAGQAPDPEWPVAQESIFGFVTLIDDVTIEYTIPSGDVIGVYTSSSEQPPGCA